MVFIISKAVINGQTVDSSRELVRPSYFTKVITNPELVVIVCDCSLRSLVMYGTELLKYLDVLHEYS